MNRRFLHRHILHRHILHRHILHSLAILTLVGVVVAGVFIQQPTQPAFACTQPVGGHPFRTIEERTATAEIVLSGTVASYERRIDNGWRDVAIIEVDRYYVGSGPSVVVVFGFGDSVMCLQSLTDGAQLIFWLKQDVSGSYFADYAGTLGAAFSQSDETLATLEAVAGAGSPAPTDGLRADDVIAELRWGATATTAARNGETPPPPPATEADNRDDSSDLIAELMLCLSSFLGPLALVWVARNRRRLL